MHGKPTWLCFKKIGIRHKISNDYIQFDGSSIILFFEGKNLLRRKYSIFGVSLLLFSCLITIYRLKMNNVMIPENQQYHHYLILYWVSTTVAIACVLLIVKFIVGKLKK